MKDGEFSNPVKSEISYGRSISTMSGAISARFAAEIDVGTASPSSKALISHDYAMPLCCCLHIAAALGGASFVTKESNVFLSFPQYCRNLKSDRSPQKSSTLSSFVLQYAVVLAAFVHVHAHSRSLRPLSSAGSQEPYQVLLFGAAKPRPREAGYYCHMASSCRQLFLSSSVPLPELLR